MKKLIALTSVLSTVLSSSLLTSNAYAADLNEIYQLSLSNDAELAVAKAKRNAGMYDANIARGALLPQVSLDATQANYDVDTELGDYDYDTFTYGATISQTLFNLNSWYNYKAASANGNASDLEYKLSEQQLILRSAAAYFDVLRARENLETAKAEEKAVKRQLEQTQQRYEVGLIAITDVHEAEASYDLSYASLIGQEAALDISYETLEQITGQRFESLAHLKNDIAFSTPEKGVDAWVKSGLAKYAGVQLAQEGVSAAEYTRKAGWSNYAPQINAQLSYSDGNSFSSVTSDVYDTTSTVLAFSATIPLFAGGSNYASAKKAAASTTQASANLDLQQRTVKNNIRSLYRQVQTDILTIKARKRATVSSQSALEATETGYEVGTRNIVEVLTAQRNLFSAQRDYANARYDYIINLLNLKFFAGSLSETDIRALNAWLK